MTPATRRRYRECVRELISLSDERNAAFCEGAEVDAPGRVDERAFPCLRERLAGREHVGGGALRVRGVQP
eukprot:11191020-Lingulodinium_polyedra.AAC.1